MDLTPEERQKIYLEEKARDEARSQIEKEKTPTKDKTPSKWRRSVQFGCLGIIGALFLIGFLMEAIAKNRGPARATAPAHLPGSPLPPAVASGKVTAEEYARGAAQRERNRKLALQPDPAVKKDAETRHWLATKGFELLRKDGIIGACRVYNDVNHLRYAEIQVSSEKWAAMTLDQKRAATKVANEWAREQGAQVVNVVDDQEGREVGK